MGILGVVVVLRLVGAAFASRWTGPLAVAVIALTFV